MAIKNTTYFNSITYIIAWLIFIILRVVNIVRIIEPKIYTDSPVYLSIAAQPLYSSQFWGAKYPIITPLVYKLLGGNTSWIAIFQSVFSILSWTILAFAVAQLIQTPWLKWVTFCAILVFSLSDEIVLWDWVILSESISISLMALFIAAWLILIKKTRWNWARISIVLVVGSLWMLTRDTNALLVIGVAFLLLALVILKIINRRFLFVVVYFLVLFIPGFISTNSGGRWISPNLRIMSFRILPSPEYTSFYQEQGMPVTPELLTLVGTKSKLLSSGRYDNPVLDDFRQWHREHGKSVYLKFLLSTPIDTLILPIQNISMIVYTEPLFNYSPRGFDTIIPFPIDQIIFFKYWNSRIAWGMLILVATGTALAFWKKERKWIALLAMFILIYPHLLMIWHFAFPEALEFRHAHHFNVHLRLFIWIALFFIIDDLSIYIIPRYIPFFRGMRFGFVGVGLIITILSLTIDFITPGQNHFSFGYAQSAGLLVGLLSMYIGFRLHMSNLKT